MRIGMCAGCVFPGLDFAAFGMPRISCCPEAMRGHKCAIPQHKPWKHCGLFYNRSTVMNEKVSALWRVITDGWIKLRIRPAFIPSCVMHYKSRNTFTRVFINHSLWIYLPLALNLGNDWWLNTVWERNRAQDAQEIVWYLFVFALDFQSFICFLTAAERKIVSVDSEDAEEPSSSTVNTSWLWQMDGSEQKCQVKEGAAFPQDKEWGLCRMSDT